MRILDRINSHNDLLQLNDQERTQLCQEIREFLSLTVPVEKGFFDYRDVSEENQKKFQELSLPN